MRFSFTSAAIFEALSCDSFYWLQKIIQHSHTYLSFGFNLYGDHDVTAGDDDETDDENCKWQMVMLRNKAE